MLCMLSPLERVDVWLQLSFFFTKILKGLVGLQGIWHWNPSCWQASTTRYSAEQKGDLWNQKWSKAVVGCQIEGLQLMLMQWQSSHWAKLVTGALCSQKELCKVENRVGGEGEGGPKSQKGRTYSAAWYVLNIWASCCDFQKLAWCKWWSLNLLAGWGRERLILLNLCRKTDPFTESYSVAK